MKRLKEFRDEVTAWYVFLGTLVAIGTIIAPFFQLLMQHYAPKSSQTYFILFSGFMALVTLMLVGWTGYIVRGVRDRDRLYHGFRRLSKAMSYEVDEKDRTKYTLRYTDEVRIATNRVVIYPIRYHWSGEGKETVPKAYIIDDDTKEKKPQLVFPESEHYIESDGEGRGPWVWYFIAINPPRYRSKKPITILYEQEFHDQKNKEDSRLDFWVTDGDLKMLTLQVKLQRDHLPLTRCQYRHGKPVPQPSDREDITSMYNKSAGHLVSWSIPNPKKDYVYRFDWRKLESK